MQDGLKSSGIMFGILRAAIAFALALFAMSAYSASKTILVLGDSLSAEYGLPRGSGWVALMDKRLAAEKFDARIFNASISGETTSGGRNRLPALLAQHKPDVVVIELGGNDGLRGLPLAATEANLDAMVQAAKQAHAKVLLVGMQIPPNYGRDYAQRFAAIFAKVAKEKKTALAPFLLEGLALDTEYFQADRIHPTVAAQKIMLDNVWPYLKPLLAK